MYLLDTNAIIYYIDDVPSVVQVIEDIVAQEVPVYVSTLTELELFSYSALTEADEARIDAVLATVRVVPLISRIARIAGDLRRLSPRLKTADSAIAATALFTNSTLVTRNVQDFKRIDTLRVLQI
ncbi:MAG: type II toxin-antitoxin system VapC family toxin [Candidatus Binatia bacterium]